MNDSKRLNILFLAPFCDGTDVGESFNSHRWANMLSKHVNLTILSLHRKGQPPLADQLPNARAITWDEPYYPESMERFNAMLKPGYIKYYVLVKRWIKAALASGEHFDLIHQMTPAAMRYPSPGIGFGIPLIHGPMQGSLETPAGLLEESSKGSAWFMKLRNLDRLRLKYDPMLRRSYQNTDLLLAGAEYARDLLKIASPKKVELLVHLNIEAVIHHPERKLPSDKGSLRLLHVGRAVRTKGLQEALKALTLVNSSIDVSLDVIGDGPELDNCRKLASSLGIDKKVTFHGKQPRNVVEDFYAKCDAMVFPSYREPAGGVVLEAMRHGLPVITTSVGGPGFYVNASCGYNVAPNSSSQMSQDIASAITDLCASSDVYLSKQQGAYARAEELGNFDSKLEWLLGQYKQISQCKRMAS